MIASLICVISLATLVQFAISQWRSVWLTIAAQQLSKSFEAATGIAHDSVDAEHFEWLVQVNKEKFPSPQEGHSWLKAVGLYRQALSTFLRLSGDALPLLSDWTRQELRECSKYAAAILDRRLTAKLACSSIVAE